VRAEVSDVEAQIARETDQIIANVKTEYQVAKERERSLDESLEQLKREQNVSKEVTVKLRDLEREAETSRRVLDAFLIRYKQTVETQELALPDSRIVESASVPFAPVSPKRLQISIIGLVLGLGLGVGMALLLELMRKGLGKAEEIEAAMGLPMLGSVPMLKRQSDGLSDPMHALRVVVAHPGGAVARAMRELAENLARRSFDNGARIVLMTASLPNEGTTLTASNLALAMTARGVRTLLIDADLRRSKLTHHMGLAQSRGLVDAIGCGQDFETVILTDTVSGLAIIPAGDVGRYPLAPQEALEAPGFGQRLARLKAHFDLILIDAPPILPVVDTRILASHADQIVLVAVWQRTPKELLRKAVRLLGSNAARLSGIVLNRVDAKVHVAGSVDGRARKEPKRGPGARRAA
ncbi:MAG: polysaccharide biosynthesis tyrosine autokinase, partial [Hyphomicrobiaceae bacterium]